MKGFRPQTPARSGPDKTLSSKRVYEELRRAILHGEFAPGTSLGETQVGEMLGVSRTPVRQAFAELLNQGVLAEGARRQVVIADPSPEQLDEILLMREALEPTLARRAAERMDVSDVDQLRLIMIRARRAIDAHDIDAFLDCDDDFHLHIPHTLHHLLAEDTLRRLLALTRLSVSRSACDEAFLRRIATEHDQIIDSLSASDPEAAGAAVTAHLASSAPHPY